MMTVYALYAAAFEEEEWMIEDRLIRRAKINAEDWPKVKKELNKQVLGTFDPPKEKAIFFCTVYCMENGIRQEEFEAIKKVVDNFEKNGVSSGEKCSTAAACIIWLVLKNSSFYQNKEKFSLQSIANYFKGKCESTVRKFYNNHVKDQEKALLVSFPSMIIS